MTQPHSVTAGPAATLGRSPLPELRRLVVEETGTEIVLHGQVSSYHFKQLAQEAVRRHLAGRTLRNLIRVT